MMMNRKSSKHGLGKWCWWWQAEEKKTYIHKNGRFYCRKSEWERKNCDWIYLLLDEPDSLLLLAHFHSINSASRRLFEFQQRTFWQILLYSYIHVYIASVCLMNVCSIYIFIFYCIVMHRYFKEPSRKKHQAHSWQQQRIHTYIHSSFSFSKFKGPANTSKLNILLLFLVPEAMIHIF